MWMILVILPAVMGLDNLLTASQKQSLIDEGARQLMSMRNSSTMPRFGDCWTRALDHLDTTCAALNERSQAELAMRFGKCFMEMTTGEVALANTADDPGDPDLWCRFGDHACMRRLPDRHFAAFSQFYTQTVQVCYFVHGQRWHDQTQRQIEALRHQSQRVQAKMEVAGQLQATMLGQQKEQIELQRLAQEQSMALSNALGAGREQVERMAEEWRKASDEQRRMMGDVFGRLVELHAWLTTEGAWSGRWAWWISYGCIGWALVVAGGERTKNAKLPMVLMLVIGVWFDGQLWSFLVLTLDEHQAYCWISMLRRFFVICMIATWLTVAVRYTNNHLETLDRLKRLEIQLEDIHNILKTVIPTHNVASFVREATPVRASPVMSIGSASSIHRHISITPQPQQSVSEDRRYSSRIQHRQKLNF